MSCLHHCKNNVFFNVVGMFVEVLQCKIVLFLVCKPHPIVMYQVNYSELQYTVPATSPPCPHYRPLL